MIEITLQMLSYRPKLWSRGVGFAYILNQSYTSKLENEP